MVEARHRLDGSQQRWAGIFDAWRRNDALRAAGPPLLFGLRLWASVCLALYVAFWLELDNALLGRHHRCDRVSATSWCVAAQGLVPHDRHRGGRRGDRGADRMLPAGPRSVSHRSGAVGRRLRARRHASAATSRPMRRRWPATRRRSSPPIPSVRPAARTGRSSCSRSPARARSASASCAPASSSPGPISAAPNAGWPRCSRTCRPKSRGDLPACWRWPGRDCRRRSRSDASSSGGSLRSIRSSTRRSANPPNSAIIRRCCRRPWTACSPLWPAGARSRCTSRGCRTIAPGTRRRPSCAACRRSCDRGRRRVGRPAGWPTPAACTGSVRRRCRR